MHPCVALYWLGHLYGRPGMNSGARLVHCATRVYSNGLTSHGHNFCCLMFTTHIKLLLAYHESL